MTALGAAEVPEVKISAHWVSGPGSMPVSSAASGSAAFLFEPPPSITHVAGSLAPPVVVPGLTRAEVQTFHGMLRQIAWKLKGQGEE
mgnify:CR=1 FL=1